ncbi:hypothetical protein [Shewanella mesophila]|nr:hypothetical protein [Shewanella mesophila]
MLQQVPIEVAEGRWNKLREAGMDARLASAGAWMHPSAAVAIYP